jgi:hypothetical protein
MLPTRVERAISCGVDDDAFFRNVFFRLMQAHSEFPFLWFSAEVSWEINRRPPGTHPSHVGALGAPDGLEALERFSLVFEPDE